jgi:hypothetical protein
VWRLGLRALADGPLIPSPGAVIGPEKSSLRRVRGASNTKSSMRRAHCIHQAARAGGTHIEAVYKGGLNEAAALRPDLRLRLWRQGLKGSRLRLCGRRVLEVAHGRSGFGRGHVEHRSGTNAARPLAVFDRDLGVSVMCGKHRTDVHLFSHVRPTPQFHQVLTFYNTCAFALRHKRNHPIQWACIRSRPMH